MRIGDVSSLPAFMSEDAQGQLVPFFLLSATSPSHPKTYACTRWYLPPSSPLDRRHWPPFPKVAVGMFRFLAALGRTFEVANSYGNLAVILNMILSGFVMSKDNIHPWWIWVRSGRDSCGA